MKEWKTKRVTDRWAIEQIVTWGVLDFSRSAILTCVSIIASISSAHSTFACTNRNHEPRFSHYDHVISPFVNCMRRPRCELSRIKTPGYSPQSHVESGRQRREVTRWIFLRAISGYKDIWRKEHLRYLSILVKCSKRSFSLENQRIAVKLMWYANLPL